MDIRKRIGKERLYFDGATGTLLQNMGLKEGDTVRIENFEFEYTED